MSSAEEYLTEVCRLLDRHAGFQKDSLGAQAVAHAVRRRIAASGAEDAADYLRLILRDPAEFQELVEEVVVPETWFFRDESAFRALSRHVGDWREATGDAYRVLSVACSTGEEVYSLAMALRDAGLDAAKFRVLGVDLSRRSIEAARQGVFPGRSFRDLGPALAALRERWFRREGQSWQAGDVIRVGVEFRCDNLARREFLAGEPPFDAVFCRNVLIYLHAAARQEAIRHLHRLLKPGGLVCAAPAEASIFSQAGFLRFGGDCPFAFQRPDRLADSPVAPPPYSDERPRTVARTTAPSPPRVPVAPAPVAAAPRGAGTRPVVVPPAAPAEVPGPALLAAARAAADGGRLEEADRLCGDLLAHDPADTEAHCLRGVVQQARGMLAEAQRSFERALYLDPKHYQSLVHLMLLARERGDAAVAANYQRRARRAAPREAE